MTTHLITGDCLKILPTMKAGNAALVITSPPYNLKRQWWDGGANGCLKSVAEKHKNRWYEDTVPESEYQEQQKRAIRECLRIAPCVAYNHRLRYAFKRCGRSFHPMEWLAEFPLWVEIIWDRGSGITFNSRRPIVADERIFVLGRPVAWRPSNVTTVWRIPPDSGRDKHPCAFPVELAVRLMDIFSTPGATILDPYMGSGTVGVACVKTGRSFIGIDRHEPYVEMARRRINATTGPLFA